MRARIQLSRNWLLGLYLALLLALALSPSAQAETVTLTLDWVPYGKHALMYSALDLGYFKDAGLEVNIQRGYGSGDTISRVGVKKSEFGFADYGTLVIARAKGTSVKGTAVLHAIAPYAIHAFADTGIRTPKDLEGKRVGKTPAGSQTALWPSFAQMAGIDRSKVIEVSMDATALAPSLLAGKIDANIGNYTSERVKLVPEAKKLGKELITIAWADHGFDIYSNGYVAHDGTIKDQPDLVRRFTEASMKGVAWTVENPEGAVERLRKYHPTIEQKLGVAMLQFHIWELMVEEAKEHGIGWISKEKMTRTRDLVLKAMNLPITYPVEDLYTMEFRPRLFPKWKRPPEL